MTMTTIDSLPDAATLWIFGTDRPLGPVQAATLVQTVDSFLADWKAHGSPVLAARELIDDRFIMIAADPAGDPSGCSIDRLYRAFGELENVLGVRLRDAGLIYFRDRRGDIRSVPRAEFRSLAGRGEVGPGTSVFDTTIGTLGKFRSGVWELPAGASWHRSLLAGMQAAGSGAGECRG